MAPNFLIIGAAKAATTWISRSIDRHPSVYVYPDEIHFFSRHFDYKYMWYKDHFKSINGACIVGEKSNTYLVTPECPARISATIPDVKMIAILRSPVERAYAGYCMQFSRGNVSHNIRIYLDPDAPRSLRSGGFLDQGLYARHLKRFFNFFDHSQIKICLYDDLTVKGAGITYDILDFLEIECRSSLVFDEGRLNVRPALAYPLALRFLASLLERRTIGKPILDWVANHDLFASMKSRLRSRRIRYPQLSSELKSKLMAFYEPDVVELEHLLGRDLSSWRHLELS